MKVSDLSKSRDEIFALQGISQEKVAADVLILREWLRKMPHLAQDLPDQFLEILLLKNKFSMEKAKRKIENYCSMKSNERYRYLYKDIPLIVPSQETEFFMPLPKLTDQYYRIIVSKATTVENYNLERNIRTAFVMRELLSYNDYNNGEIFIYDYSTVSVTDLLQELRLNVLADAFSLLMEGHSARVKALHIISKIGSLLINPLRPALPEKIKSRIFFHSNYESLTKEVSPDYLPKDLGGNLKTTDEFKADYDSIYAENWEKIMKYRNTRSSEELKQGGDSFVEMKGTFRKLNID